MKLSLVEVMALIPQRPPFLFVRSAEVLNEGEVHGLCRWDADNPIFAGHFPGFAVVPGVLLAEAAAQLACIAVAQRCPINVDASDPPVAVVTTVRRFVVHKPVFPEMEIKYCVKLEEPVGLMFGIRFDASVSARRILKGEMVLAIVNRSKLLSED